MLCCYAILDKSQQSFAATSSHPASVVLLFYSKALQPCIAQDSTLDWFVSV